MKQRIVTIVTLAALLSGTGSSAFAQEASIRIRTGEQAGLIDEKIYGQLFEHIYFSANNGVWQELIYERSFEPEQYPGIHPRDGFFDGWYADDEQVLHSPTRYEQPINLASVDTDSYEISMDVNWRAYKLARRSWSGGLEDIRIAFKNQPDGSPYYFRIHDPYYEAQRFSPAQTEAMRQANEAAKAMEKLTAGENKANFSISTMVEQETPFFGGRTRKMKVLTPVKSTVAKDGQIDESQTWHKLRILCKGKSVKAWWDGKAVVSATLEGMDSNDLALWVNYTEAYFRNIKVSSADGRKVYFEGLPDDVKTPAVAQQWNGYGKGVFSLVKDDAVNMRYSQRIDASKGESGVRQGPQNVVRGERFIGSIYAKGDGRAELSVSLRKDGEAVASRRLGVPGADWTKYDFTLVSDTYEGAADFSIDVKGGALQVDQVSMTTASGQALGGFRPDIFKAVDELHPTCLRWPGGGYVAQYNWKWGIGPQEQRQRWPNWMWMDYDQNAFGTDEFIRFCREIGTEPVIVVSVHFERPEEEFEAIKQEALDWLRYCNEPATGEWGKVRAANGHPEPYNVKYWEIDNEMWEMGIDRYERCVREFSTEMRKIDPNIKIIACGGFPEDEAFLKRSSQYFDYLSLHHYEQKGGYATGPERLGEQYRRYADMIAASPNPHVKLFISEWNLQSIDWRTGLFAGGFLNMCENTPVVELGAAALFIRRTDMPDWDNAFINFDYKDVFVAPNYQVTKLWWDHFSRYRIAYEGDEAGLSICTTLSEDGRDVIVKVVNSSDEPVSLSIDGDWDGIDDASYEFYAPGSLDVRNSMEDKNAVALKYRKPEIRDGKLKVGTDALSAGVIVIRRSFSL